MTLRRILFPIDFSDRARAVAPFVHSMAQRYRARVVLLHVIQPPPPLYGGLDAQGGMSAVYPETFDYEASRRAIVKNLEEFGAREIPKIEVSSVVDIGDPASAIVQYVHENEIDLICMATQGHGAFRRALLGSVTAKVLHDAKVPVWMSAHAPEATHRAHPQPRHVLVAIDTDGKARETLDAAVALARETEATLELVTAVAEGVVARSMSDVQLDGLLVDGTRELLRKLQFEAGTQLEMIIRVGTPADVVRAAAVEQRADLVICGHSTAHGGEGHGVFGHLHDDNYAIIREAPCPVLSV